jgi:hypothetical protein
MKNEHLSRFYGINFGFDNDLFYVEYHSAGRPVGNLREEFDIRAKELYSNVPNLMLGLSSGLDSQSVLHSFYSQGIAVETAFLYLPGFNEVEFNNLKILERKYGFKSAIIDFDAHSIKDEVMDMHRELNLPPNQILHRMFLEKLPEDKNFIQGIHGPDLLYKNDKWLIIETANSFEVARLRAFLTINERKGKIIGWERTPEIMLSLLNDDIVKAFMCASGYISRNGLVYKSGDPIPFIDNWDLYIKPFIYGKYWKNELEYFPKYQGPEGIDWIMNGPRHEYNKNVTAISYKRLMEQLTSDNEFPIKVYQVQ